MGELQKKSRETQAVVLENRRKRMELDQLQKAYSNAGNLNSSSNTSASSKKPLGLADMEAELSKIDILAGGANSKSKSNDQPKPKRSTMKSMASVSKMLMGKTEKQAGGGIVTL